MGVFPARVKGELTGKWWCEVRRNNVRKRDRFADYAKAKAAEKQWLHEFKNGTVTETKPIETKPPQPETLDQLIQFAKGSLWRGNAAEKTAYQRLNSCADIIGRNRKIASISAVDGDTITKYLLNNGRSEKTVNRYISALSAAMRWARKRNYLQKELPEFDWQVEGEGRIRVISPEEEVQLYQHVRCEKVRVLIRIAIVTGTRRSELLSLKPSQVEPEWIHLYGDGKIARHTKNKCNRDVAIDQQTYDQLNWLFQTAFPKHWELRNEWAKARKAMGLLDDPHFTFHACRHTCATRSLMAGNDVSIVQQQLGHKTIQTTLKYTHINKPMLQAALRKMLGNRAKIASEAPPTLLEASGTVPISV